MEKNLLRKLFLMVLGILILLPCRTLEASEYRSMGDADGWQFVLAIKPPTELQLRSADKHRWGNEVGYYRALFVDAYVSKEEVVPGDPRRRTVIAQPGIYNAVLRVEKELRKLERRDKLTKDEVADEFIHVLLVAIGAHGADTGGKFEEELERRRKDTDATRQLFREAAVKSLY